MPPSSSWCRVYRWTGVSRCDPPSWTTLRPGRIRMTGRDAVDRSYARVQPPAVTQPGEVLSGHRGAWRDQSLQQATNVIQRAIRREICEEAVDRGIFNRPLGQVSKFSGSNAKASPQAKSSRGEQQPRRTPRGLPRPNHVHPPAVNAVASSVFHTRRQRPCAPFRRQEAPSAAAAPPCRTIIWPWKPRRAASRVFLVIQPPAAGAQPLEGILPRRSGVAGSRRRPGRQARARGINRGRRLVSARPGPAGGGGTRRWRREGPRHSGDRTPTTSPSHGGMRLAQQARETPALEERQPRRRSGF